MAFVGLDNYVIIAMTVGGSKASDIKLVLLQPQPRTCIISFLAGSILRDEEPIDDAVRELHEETCLVLTMTI
jgi:8-oxo-dGTP pyrophosphatase MutT (NUDIX family)